MSKRRNRGNKAKCGDEDFGGLKQPVVGLSLRDANLTLNFSEGLFSRVTVAAQIMGTRDDISTHRNYAPLFFHKSPLVCYKIPFVEPLVSLNIPLVKVNKFNAGFSLVELVITLTIAGILLALAVPAMQTFILDQRLTTQANDFIADLNLARSEAVRRAASVTVCKQGGTVTSPSCSTSAAWSAGRVVYVDTDSDSTLDSGETVLRVRESLDGTSNTLNAIPSSTNSIVFAGTGLTTLSSGTEIAMRLCDSRGASKAVTVWINSTGRTRIDRTTVSSCTS